MFRNFAIVILKAGSMSVMSVFYQ